jgi:hypothetical protein
MTHVRAGIGTIVAALLAATAAAAAQAPSTADRDMAEVRAYRLTMPKLQAVRQIYAQFFESIRNDPQFVAVQTLQKEKAALEAKAEPTEADQQRIEQIDAEIERIEGGLNLNVGQKQTLADMARAFESNPKMNAAIRGAGLTPREFATIQLALFEAVLAHGFQKSGTIKELPKEFSQENIQFVREHEAEITALMSDLQKQSGADR